MGTPDFAVPSLRALLENGYEVVGVFCQPDRPKGRGHKLAACPVKELAQSAGIPVFQPERIKREEGVAMLKSCAPDLCVTAAFGQLLSQEILDIPPLGTINVHSSLLPRHRGSAPINWSIIKGDPVTGVTTMFTDKGIEGCGLFALPEEAVKASGAEYYVLDELPPEPSYMAVQKLVDEFKASGADMIVACGGGSVMDSAKAIAAMIDALM